MLSAYRISDEGYSLITIAENEDNAIKLLPRNSPLRGSHAIERLKFDCSNFTEEEFLYTDHAFYALVNTPFETMAADSLQMEFAILKHDLKAATERIDELENRVEDNEDRADEALNANEDLEERIGCLEDELSDNIDIAIDSLREDIEVNISGLEDDIIDRIDAVSERVDDLENTIPQR